MEKTLVCPDHGANLRENRWFPEYLTHDGCGKVFREISGRLCVLRDGQWVDTETGETRNVVKQICES